MGEDIEEKTRKFAIPILIPSVLFALTFVVFLASPLIKLDDSKYAMLLSEQLLRHQSFKLDDYFWPKVDSRHYPEVLPGRRLPRHIIRQAKHLYYVYPHGTSLLSVPLVAIMRLFGLSTIQEDGRYNFEGEKLMQKLAASLLMAVTCLVFFFTARLLLNEFWSVLIALAGAFGTQIWSTASRSMQSHAWSTLLLSLALYIILRAELKLGEMRPILLATILAAAFFVRPTSVAYIVPLALFVLVRFRQKGFWLMGAALTWLALLFIYSQHNFHHYLPFYFRFGAALKLKTLGIGLPAQLISPSRGLLVYVPLVIFVGYLLVAYRRQLRSRSVVAVALISIAFQVLIVSAWWAWWAGAGGTYGARFTTEVVPLFVLLGVLGTEAALPSFRHARKESGPQYLRLRRALEIGVFGAFLIIGVVFNGAGAISRFGTLWNRVPNDIDQNPKRIFDWKHPQFYCALFPYRISGIVKNNNWEPLYGVAITLSGGVGGGRVVTNSKGHYSIAVGFGWTGRARPARRGFLFDPPVRNYCQMSSSLTNEHYVGSPQKKLPSR